MAEVLLDRAAASRRRRSPVLLTGETGTGKEMLARAIHRASDRADRPFMPFNCTAVPRDMLESQLFGYRTRRVHRRRQRLRRRDPRRPPAAPCSSTRSREIGLDLQPKLLRFLETGEIHPLGEPQPIKVDVRVIAATNADLEQLVAEGRFREDLFYRLNVVRLKLPPLRERREEIPPLVEHYLRRFADELKKGRLTLDDETLEYLLLYTGPATSASSPTRCAAWSRSPTPTRTVYAGAALAGDPGVAAHDCGAGRGRAGSPRPRSISRSPTPSTCSSRPWCGARSSGRTGNVEEAARLLGISRKGLFLKRRRWGLHTGLLDSALPEHPLRLPVVADDVRGRPLADLVDADRADDRMGDAHAVAALRRLSPSSAGAMRSPRRLERRHRIAAAHRRPAAPRRLAPPGGRESTPRPPSMRARESFASSGFAAGTSPEIIPRTAS